MGVTPENLAPRPSPRSSWAWAPLAGVRNPVRALWLVGILLSLALMFDFMVRSVWMGLWGLTNDLTGLSSFFSREMPVVTFMMFFHLITGAAMLVLGPVQLLDGVRKRWRGYHRWAGRVMVALGLVTALGGLLFAVFHGTTGGRFMDVTSALYAALMIVAAMETYRHGRAKRWPQHRRWGWRLTVLALASWFYRIHYVIWDAMFGDLWVTPDMTGPFDRFQAWAFYISYLALLEVYFLFQARRRRA